MTIMPKAVKINQNFVAREWEITQLNELSNTKEPIILVVHGRRRVGKTELLEQTYRDRNIIKFEGVRNKTKEAQMEHVLWQLSEYLGQPYIAKVQVKTWAQVFKLIYDNLPDGVWTLYFEEVQWLANYEQEFVAELKFAWDNYFKDKESLILILCGSSPSFIINEILMSEALYNRSQYELPLRELSLKESKDILVGRSNREVMDAYLLVGGIPLYLKWLNTDSSVFTSLCINSFKPGGYFLNECKRIFVSSMSEKKHYKDIIEFLAKRKFATRDEILKSLKVKSSGATTALLEDLELCGFIQRYTPYNLAENSKLGRYCIVDPYLQYYYKFIQPRISSINNGDYIDQPTFAIKTDVFNKWLGFAFERFCRRNHRLIASILGFKAVHYQSGAFFNRNTKKEEPGFQFDLVFDRDDRVMTLCEIRYYQGKVDSTIIEQFERKIALLPNPKRKTLHKVLITTEGADQSLIRRAYFDDVIVIDDFF